MVGERRCREIMLQVGVKSKIRSCACVVTHRREANNTPLAGRSARVYWVLVESLESAELRLTRFSNVSRARLQKVARLGTKHGSGEDVSVRLTR
jgi:hypothetical protein